MTSLDMNYKSQLNAQLLEQRLLQQQKESEEDSRWLAESETNLVSLYSIFFKNYIYGIFLCRKNG